MKSVLIVLSDPFSELLVDLVDEPESVGFDVQATTPNVGSLVALQLINEVFTDCFEKPFDVGLVSGSARSGNKKIDAQYSACRHERIRKKDLGAIDEH